MKSCLSLRNTWLRPRVVVSDAFTWFLGFGGTLGMLSPPYGPVTILLSALSIVVAIMIATSSLVRAAIGVMGAVVILFYSIAFLDAFSCGPYTTWHNSTLSETADAHALVGSSENSVVAILGEPTSIDKSQDGHRTTYNYAPFPVIRGYTFQVHCADGKVVGTEMYDL